jgi:hypothetical protein
MSRLPINNIPHNPLTANVTRTLNVMARQLGELAYISAPNGIIANRGPLGTSLMNTAPNRQPVQFFGVLVDKGPPTTGSPNGQIDFTDSRYWVRQIYLNQTQGASMTDPVVAFMDATYLQSDGSYLGGLWVEATNLPESLVGTHLMPTMSVSGSSVASVISGATIVLVTQENAVKQTQLPNDFGNAVFVFNPITNISSLTSATGFVTITSVVALSATSWRAIGSFDSGGTQSIYHRESLNGIAGTPGSLGINIGTDGTVTGTTCVVKPPGLGRRKVFYDPTVPGYVFEFQNSSG